MMTLPRPLVLKLHRAAAVVPEAVSKGAVRVGRRLGGPGRLLQRSGEALVRARRFAPWFAAGGDKILRLDYDLGESSVVFDIGGFEGQWASDVFGRYVCTVHLFEAVPRFAEQIERRFERNPKVMVHPFGLGASDQTFTLRLAADGTSAFQDGGETITASEVRAGRFLDEHGIETVDLMKINIEGGEYELLEHLLDEGLVSRIRDLQIQFHDFVPNAERRMRAIQERLSETHTRTYAYDFVWENWRANNRSDGKAPPG